MAKRKYSNQQVTEMIRRVRKGTSSALLLALCDAAEERSGAAVGQKPGRQAYMRKYMREYRKSLPGKKTERAAKSGPASAPQNKAHRHQEGRENQKTEPVGGLFLGEIKF